MTRFIAFSFIALSATGLFAAEQRLSLSFDGRAAVVDGVTPGGQLVVYSKGVSESSLHHAATMGIRFVVRDATGSGRVRIDAGRELPPDSVWALIDVSSGRHEVISRGALARRSGLPPGVLRSLGVAQANRLTLDLPIAEVLVVRPGEGAWHGVIADGGESDDDARPDGHAVFSPRALKEMQAKNPKVLDRVRKRDVVVIIDPVTLRSWSSVEVGE
ncbi:MAG TPA: hypothetical protein VND45_00365 [Thermoanaerobaculia bacterium]|jgi:hypothetical protein|nr:hypothetical protein [Thermoanaerobaculia bacterium]